MVIVQDPVKNLGQYFTPTTIAEFMVKLITKEEPVTILEPSAGTGVFVSALEKEFNSITAIEIDDSLSTTATSTIHYENFFDLSPDKKFDVVIGNPPYVRWRNQPQSIREDIIQRKFWDNRLNALADMMQAFIFKSIDHLRPGGELIFLTPKFWLETLHATNLRNYILETGFIDLLIDFSETKLFPKVSSNLIIFRYHKAKRSIDQKIKVFAFRTKRDTYDLDLEIILKLLANEADVEQFLANSNLDYYQSQHPVTDQSWKLYADTNFSFIQNFEKSCETNFQLEVQNKEHTKETSKKKIAQRKEEYVTIADVFKIGNGMVSGLDKAFYLEKNPIMKKNPKKLTLEEKKFIKKVVKARYMEQYNVKHYAEYIFIEEKDFSSEEEFKKQCPNLYALLKPFKNELLKRWSVKPVPWYVWSFPRNQSLFETIAQKFFLPCKERFDNKGFIRCVNESADVFGVQDITVLGLKKWVKESPEYFLAYFNSELLYKWLLIKGLRRGGVFQFSEHPLSSIPLRLINWKNKNEIEIHNLITKKIILLKKEQDKTLRKQYKDEIENLFSTLFSSK